MFMVCFSCPTTTLALTYPSEKVVKTDDILGRRMTAVMLPTKTIGKTTFSLSILEL